MDLSLYSLLISLEQALRIEIFDGNVKEQKFDDISFKKETHQIILPSCSTFFVSFKWREGVVLGALGLEEREFSVDSWTPVLLNW